MQPTFDEVKDNDKIRYFTLYRRKMCKISHFSTIECDFCSKRDYLSRFHYLPFFLFVSRFRKNKGRIVLVLRLSALPPPRVIPLSLSSSHLRSQKD